jgi:hypothetical protein
LADTLESTKKYAAARDCVAAYLIADAVGRIDGVGRPHGPSRGLNTSGSADADVGAL